MTSERVNGWMHPYNDCTAIVQRCARTHYIHPFSDAPALTAMRCARALPRGRLMLCSTYAHPSSPWCMSTCTFSMPRVRVSSGIYVSDRATCTWSTHMSARRAQKRWSFQICAAPTFMHTDPHPNARHVHMHVHVCKHVCHCVGNVVIGASIPVR